MEFTSWDAGLHTYDTNSIQHFGIKGQKWGQRRFQNSDGSLTAAGRQHYGVAEGGHSFSERKTNRLVKKAARNEEIAKNAKVRELANKKRELEKKHKVSGDDLDGWDPKTGKQNYGIDQRQYNSIINARSEYKRAKEKYKSDYGYDFYQAGKIGKKASKLVKKKLAYERRANKAEKKQNKNISIVKKQ